MTDGEQTRYHHAKCDAAILDNRLGDACDGCKDGMYGIKKNSPQGGASDAVSADSVSAGSSIPDDDSLQSQPKDNAELYKSSQDLDSTTCVPYRMYKGQP